MRIACWIPKATDTHTEYVTLIAFPQQQWLTRTRLIVTLYAILCLVLTRFITVFLYIFVLALLCYRMTKFMGLKRPIRLSISGM